MQLAQDPNFVELKWALATPEALDQLRQAVKVLSASVSVVCGLGDKNGPDWIREYGVRGWTSYTVNHAPGFARKSSWPAWLATRRGCRRCKARCWRLKTSGSGTTCASITGSLSLRCKDVKHSCARPTAATTTQNGAMPRQSLPVSLQPKPKRKPQHRLDA
jgi:hypothetical protein